MFRALAAWHRALVSLPETAVCAAVLAGAWPPVALLGQRVVDGLVAADLAGQVRRDPVGGQDEVKAGVRDSLSFRAGLGRRVDRGQRLLRLGLADRDAGLAGEFLLYLEPDQPGERLLGLLLLAQLHGALVLLDGLVEVVDLGVQRRDRDPLVAGDGGGAELDRAAAARAKHEAGAQDDGGHLDKPPKHPTIPSHVAGPGRSASTDRMTSPHQVSSSVSRTGCPPMGAVFGTGTSIVRTVGLSIVFG